MLPSCTGDVIWCHLLHSSVWAVERHFDENYTLYGRKQFSGNSYFELSLMLSIITSHLDSLIRLHRSQFKTIKTKENLYSNICLHIMQIKLCPTRGLCSPTVPSISVTASDPLPATLITNINSLGAGKPC